MCDCVRSVYLTPAMAGSSVSADPEELTLDNVRDGKVKINVLKKVQLQELCNTFIGHIDRLELELEKNKAHTTCPPPTRPSRSGQSSRS
jgi:hypothetical protein